MADFDDIGVRAVVQNFALFQRQLGQMDRSVSGFGSAGAMGMGAVNVALGAIVAGAAAAVAAIAGIATAIGKVAIVSFETAVSVETAFTGITKTTSGLIDTTTFELTELGETIFQEFRDLAKKIPPQLEDLMAIGEIAGQMGIAPEQLAGFTEQIAQIGVSTDLSTEQAAFAIARMAAIFSVADEDVVQNTQNIGSALIALGNQFPTTESKIMHFADRIGGASAALGFTQQEVLAIGAAMTSVGVETQRGGTAVQKVMIAMQEALVPGSDELEIFSSAMGITNDAFITMVETDPAGAFLAFTESLGEGGPAAIQTLKDLELGDQRLIGAFLNLSGASGVLEEAMGLANVSMDEGSALAIEAGKRWETFAEQWNLLKSQFADIALTIGINLADIAEAFIKSDFVKEFTETLAEELPKAFEELTTAFEEYLAPALGRLLDSLGIELSGAGIAEFLAGIVSSAADVVEWVGLAIWNLSTFIDMIKLGVTGENILKTLGFSDEAIEPLMRIWSLLSDIGIAIKDHIVEEFGKWGDWFSANKTDMWDALGTILTVLEFIGGIITDVILPTFGDWYDIVRDLGSLVLDVLAGNWEEAGKDLGSVWDGLINLLGNLGDALWGVLGTSTGEVRKFFVRLGMDLQIALIEIIGWIDLRWIELMGSLKKGWLLFAAGTLEAFDPVVQALVDGVNTVLEAINLALDFLNLPRIDLISFMGFDAAATALRNRAAQTGIDTSNALIESMRNTMAMKQHVVQNAVDEIARIDIKMMKEAGERAGENLMKGVRDGIATGQSATVDKAVRAMNAIIAATGRTFRIDSPSKIFMKFGENLMFGLAEGISNTTVAPVRALTNAIVKMEARMGPIAQGASETTINNSYNVSANYANTQSPARIADDLALMGALSR